MVTDAQRTVASQYPPARTKLLVPELPATHVPRSRLVRHLNDSVAGFAITLVAGFAGSGKTVLLAEFARSRPMGSVAWLSCDVTDADPVHFWTALVGALRTFDPAIGADALDLLGVDGQLGGDAIASLVNELLDLDGPRLLVLDDLHLVTRAALTALGELLERLLRPGGDQRPLRSKASVAPLAGERTPRRAARRRAAHGAIGGRAIRRCGRRQHFARGRRRPGRPHGGLDGGRAAGRAFDATRTGARRVHSHVRQHRPQRRRFPDR